MPTLSNFVVKLTLRLLASLKPSVISSNQKRIRQKGFVLPVAILIVLVLSLVTVGLLTRSTQRGIQTQVERATQTTNRQLNSAVDRARAKIDFLLTDRRLPRGTPSDQQLAAALINRNDPNAVVLFDPDQPYILPDENFFTLNTNINYPDPSNPAGVLNALIEAPAWWFNVDSDGDGDDDAITAYTILSQRRTPNELGDIEDFEAQISDQDRARRLMIRSGPLRGGSVLEGCRDIGNAAVAQPDRGDWFREGSVFLKPFQIYAVTVPQDGADSTTRAVSGLQFQQDRQRDALNKWGAFSRLDAELFFTPTFNWNGAIYSGGSLFFKYDAGSGGFNGYLISSPESCFYMPPDNSEIKAFGELVAGIVEETGQAGADNIVFDVHPGQANLAPTSRPTLNSPARGSVAAGNPELIALDPLDVYLFDGNRRRGTYTQDPAAWENSPLNVNNENSPGRIEAGRFQSTDDQVCPPYVDDVFRADNRFGPKPTYDRPPEVPDETTGCKTTPFWQNPNFTSARAGNDITGDPVNRDGESITGDEPPAGDLSLVGLDGYWERRSRVEGLRVVVGQRLDLTRSDSLPIPLLPAPTNADDPRNLQTIPLSNLERQRLTMRDNPAAVQAAAVYHWSKGAGRVPVACLAVTAHPGSPDSLRRASTFPTGDQTTQLGINFFTGQGTNGWEYDAAPLNARLNPGTPLWTALSNLANFAGDPDGAYPPLQEAGRIHPDPFVTAFGNFSELRRIIDNGVGINGLSLADQTTLQTAGCMLGMLADNIQRLGDAAALGTDPEAEALFADITDSRNNGAVFSGTRSANTRRSYLPLRYIFPTAGFNQTDAVEQARREAYPLLPAVQYQAVPDLSQVALQPRANVGDWSLPTAGQACGAGPNSSQFNLIEVGGGCTRIPFKDTVLFDGREAMAVRNLNVDLALLTNNVGGQSNGTINGDTWLPDGSVRGAGSQGGIFYAFREDAVREDAIARPPLLAFDTYRTAWEGNNARGDLGDNRIMNAGQRNRNAPVGDPPVEPNGGLSPKAVDYYADPERRPYGFRLINGAVLQRGGFTPDESLYGLSFITPNSVFIQGDFNLHQSGGTRLEEFTTLVAPDFSNFYTRTRNNTDTDFARAADDSWRASDIIGDSVNILSANFCDGSVDDSFTQDGTLNGGGTTYNRDRDYQNGRASSPRLQDYYGCQGPAIDNTSFINQPLVKRGPNWPAADPNNNGAGIRRFDNTDGVQDLGNSTVQPGHPDLFSRDTVPFVIPEVPNPDPAFQDNSLGGAVPQRRDLRASDENYSAFPPRLSSLANPVFDTTRWQFLATPGRCPVPDNGGGLLAEYYNGWRTDVNNNARYNRVNSFDNAGAADVAELLRVPVNPNLGYLKAVRQPDTIYPSGIPNNLAGQGATTPWGRIRDTIRRDPSQAYDPADAALNPPTESAINRRFDLAVLGEYARYKPGDPNFGTFTWGGFQNLFGGNQPFKATLNTDPPDEAFYIPTCTEPDDPDPTVVVDATDFPQNANPTDPADPFTITDYDNPDTFTFGRSCWRRRPGGNNVGNKNGRDYFATRWVGELFPVFPGQVPYQVNTDDGNRITIRSNPDYYADPTNDASVPVIAPTRSENWTTGGNVQSSITIDLECSPEPDISPYLIEIQQFENGGGAFAKLQTRSSTSTTADLETYDLRYLRPVKPVNFPCVPNPLGDPTVPRPFNDPANGRFQEYCTVDCVVVITDDKACPGAPNNCGQIINVKRTTEKICPNPADNTVKIQNIQVTCKETFIQNKPYSPYTPACTLADGGKQIKQTRQRERVTSCNNNIVIQVQSKNVTCPATCNYGNFTDWDPACPTVACGTTVDQPQTRTRNLIAATSSPSCKPTDTEKRVFECVGPPCNKLSSLPSDSDQVAVSGSDINVGLAQGADIDSFDLQQAISLYTPGVNHVPDSHQATITADVAASGLEMTEQQTLRLPNLSEAIGEVAGSVFNWVFGEPAHAARVGLRQGLLPKEIALPRLEPGIRPAEAPGTGFDPALLVSAKGTDARATELRNVFMTCPTDPGSNKGFWVPGVFRPNLNSTFQYTAYNQDSLPSTLSVDFRDIDATEDLSCTDVDTNGVLTAAERRAGFCQVFLEAKAPNAIGDVITDRDPLFGLNADGDLQVNGQQNLSGGNDVQPQMRLSPYARVTDNNTQNYGTNRNYLDGYYIDSVGPEDDIRNGLCFFVRIDSNRVQMQIDQNGNNGGGQVWVNVEALSTDINANPTGFGGANPVLGVILDERTRRPIPIPEYDNPANPLVPATNSRRRNDDGSTNRQLIDAAPTRVNTITVGGIVPPRLNQSSGGIHNFFRLNENWSGQDLNFNGSIIQLDYSNTATAPLTQQSFEPFTLVPPNGVEGFDYYFPPNRRFGYDVGLQIAREISPVSARFILPSKARTEVVRELEPQDPYIRRLRCALQNEAGAQVDPTAQIGGADCAGF